MSSTPAGPASPSLYQLRVVLHGISPLIWRRLLVPATATIAELHVILQIVFGWGDEHLHRLVIHGTEYGISYLGGPGFRDDARKVRLDELGLRAGERFTYEYNFGSRRDTCNRDRAWRGVVVNGGSEVRPRGP